MYASDPKYHLGTPMASISVFPGQGETLMAGESFMVEGWGTITLLDVHRGKYFTFLFGGTVILMFTPLE